MKKDEQAAGGKTPTRGATESRGSWEASPRLAMALRVAAFLAPLVTSWIVLLAIGSAFWRPDGVKGLLIWIVQAVAVGVLVSRVTDRVTRRLLPLASLLSLTLVFPDNAPSRFGTALRSGTLRKMSARIEDLEANGLGSDANSAAHSAIELVGFLSAHDPRTRGHTERVRAYADLIAAEMGIDQNGRDKLAWSVLLHDVGKLTVPSEILNKEAKLEPEEWEVLKAHPANGQEMLAPLADWLGEWDGAAGEHHERWDGGGYPHGLVASRISLAGRITAVADAYDVITSARSYKKPMTAEAARRELVRCSGTQFDPDVVRAMVSVSLGRRRNAGPFAFLTEMPRVIDITRVATSAPGAVLVPAAVVALGATTTLPPTMNVPDELAFAAPTVTIVEGDASTASTRPVTSPADTLIVTEFNTTTTTSPPQTTTSTVTTTSSIAESTATGATGSGSPTTSAPPTAFSPPTTAQASPTTTVLKSAPTTTTTEPSTTTTESTPGAPPPPPPSGPVTADDDVSVDNGKDKKIQVLENDSDGAYPMDPSTLTIVTPPEHAEKFRVHDSGGTFHIHYKPSKDYEGPDAIVYSVCDTSGACSTATINITVS